MPRSSPCPADASSRPRTSNGNGWSATSTTAPNSTSWPWRSTCGSPTRSRALDPRRAAGVLADQADAARTAIETLSLLSRGIYPRLLADEGLAPALSSAVSASAIPVTVAADDLGRLPAAVEAALYFCCMEAVQNAAKHSGADQMKVTVARRQERCTLTVSRRRQRLRAGPLAAGRPRRRAAQHA